MAKRKDRQRRKQDKRATRDVDKARRRGDALSLIAAELSPEQVAAAFDLVAADIELSHTRRDEARVLAFARAIAQQPELLASAEAGQQALACSWLVLAAAVQARQWALGERLLAGFGAALAARAPGLAGWCRAYVDHRGEPPTQVLRELVPIVGPVAKRSTAAAIPTDPEGLELALLIAADDVERLEAIERQIMRLEPGQRRPLMALAGQLAWRLALRAAQAPQPGAARPLALVARVADPIVDQELLVRAIRLARQLSSALTSELAQLLDSAYRAPDLRPLVLSVLDSLPPPLTPRGEQTQQEAALSLGRRLLRVDAQVRLWAWTLSWWVHADPFEQRSEPPTWLRDVGAELVRSGALARSFGDHDRGDPHAAHELCACVSWLAWKDVLRFVEQALELVEGDARRLLARLALEALQAPEHTRPAHKPKRPTVKHMIVKLERELNSLGTDPDDFEAEGEIEELLDLLRMLPPDRALPAELAHLEFVVEDNAGLGQTQLAFVERHAAQLLPHDIDLLAELVEDDHFHGRGVTLLGMHLGPEPSVDQVLRAVIVADDYEWQQLGAHALELLLLRFADDPAALARALDRFDAAGVDRDVIKPVARALLAALDRRGHADGFDPAFVRRAELLAGVRRRKAKKKPAKKQPAKKQPAKKQPAKKQPAKKQPAKKPAAKKQPAKKPAAKKQPAKKPAPALQQGLFESEDS